MGGGGGFVLDGWVGSGHNGAVEGKNARETEKRMKKALFAVLPLLLVCGCVPIPYGYSFRYERVIGERMNEEGHAEEKVIERYMALHEFWFASPEGPGVHDAHYSRYVLETPKGRVKIWQVSHFPQAPYRPFDSAHPVAGSDRWLFVKKNLHWEQELRDWVLSECDLRLLLYSPSEGIVEDKTFRRCRDDEPWRFDDGGCVAVVNAVEGKIILPLLPDPASGEAIAW